jgi:hypothetical protein
MVQEGSVFLQTVRRMENLVAWGSAAGAAITAGVFLILQWPYQSLCGGANRGACLLFRTLATSQAGKDRRFDGIGPLFLSVPLRQ